jgi:gas vesicle protein
MFRNDESAAFGYLLIGIGIGVVAGLFFAPRSGEEMREDIRRRTNEGVDYLNEQADKLRDGAETVVTKGKEWIARQTEGIQSTAETKKPSHEQI